MPLLLFLFHAPVDVGVSSPSWVVSKVDCCGECMGAEWSKRSGGAPWCEVTCWLGEMVNYQQTVYVLCCGSKNFESFAVFVQVVM